MTEVQVAALLCSLLGGGVAEETHRFDNLARARGIRVDCATSEHVIEIGLDQKAASRDSVHQAVFAAHLTGKHPMVVLIDRDGVEGRYEQEMRIVTETLGIPYAVCREDFIVRWRLTAPWRAAYRGAGAQDDLPLHPVVKSHCNISDAMDALIN